MSSRNLGLRKQAYFLDVLVARGRLRKSLMPTPVGKPRPSNFLTTTQVQYLGNLISWVKPFDTAFKHRAGLAETSYKKLRLVWNSSMSRKEKMHIFQTVFIPTLIYGLDTLTLQDKHIKRLDALISESYVGSSALRHPTTQESTITSCGDGQDTLENLPPLSTTHNPSFCDRSS